MRKLGIKFLPLIAALLLIAFSFAPSGKFSASADDSLQEVKVVSVAQPCVREISGGQIYQIIFKVYFDKDITFINYKHLAMPVSALRTTVTESNGWANPHLSLGAIDFLNENGILESINDCVYFNGKKARWYEQNIDNFGCAIHVGEQGVNNSMDVQFSSDHFNNAFSLRRELDENYEFTFKAGLKLPAGVIVAEDSTWTFLSKDRIFVEVPADANPSDAGFKANYNGKAITADDNVVTVDKNSFSLDNLYVKTNNPKAVYSTTLSENQKEITVTCVSEDKTQTETLKIAVNYAVATADGCSSGIGFAGVFPLAALLTVFAIRRNKR